MDAHSETADAVLDVLVLGTGDIVQIAGSTTEGGRADPDLVTRIEQHAGYRAAIEHRPIDRLTALAGSIRSEGAPSEGVVLTSISTAMAEAPDVDDVEAWFLETAADLVAACREQGAHLVIASGSTFDPTDKTHSYRGIDDTPALIVHRLNLALIQLSVLDGISIIDADRIVAEIGAERGVDSLLSYRPMAVDALCAEIDRILVDYRFFEAGALVPQQGRRKG